jgi:hypothetical protein
MLVLLLLSVAVVPCLLPGALQGGGVPAKKGKRATRQAGNPENRAMATRFYPNVLNCCTGRLSCWTVWFKSSESGQQC